MTINSMLMLMLIIPLVEKNIEIQLQLIVALTSKKFLPLEMNIVSA
jgi:hypothetical protein